MALPFAEFKKLMADAEPKQQPLVDENSEIPAYLKKQESEGDAFDRMPVPKEGGLPQNKPSAMGDLLRGIDNLQYTGGGLLSLLGNATGLKSLEDFGTEIYRNNQMEARQNPAAVGSYDNIHSFGDAFTYMREAVLENAPMFIPSLVTGGAGSFFAKGAAEGYVKSLIAKVGEEEAGKIIAKRILIGNVNASIQAGGTAGAYASSAGMEVGSIYADTVDQTGVKNPAYATGAGLVAGLFDAIPEGFIFKNVLGKAGAAKLEQSLIKRLRIEGAKQFIMEAPPEAIQTVIEQSAISNEDGSDLFSKENVKQYTDAFLKGGFAGGVMGAGGEAAGSILRHHHDAKVRQDERDINAMADGQTKDEVAVDPETPEAKRHGEISAEIEALSNTLTVDSTPEEQKAVQDKVAPLLAEQTKLEEIMIGKIETPADPLVNESTTEVIDSELAKKHQTGKVNDVFPEIDAAAFDADVKSKVSDALANGSDVTLIADKGNKKVKITKIGATGMLEDSEGLPWGTAWIISGDSKIEITPKPLVNENPTREDLLKQASKPITPLQSRPIGVSPSFSVPSVIPSSDSPEDVAAAMKESKRGALIEEKAFLDNSTPEAAGMDTNEFNGRKKEIEAMLADDGKLNTTDSAPTYKFGKPDLSGVEKEQVDASREQAHIAVDDSVSPADSVKPEAAQYKGALKAAIETVLNFTTGEGVTFTKAKEGDSFQIVPKANGAIEIQFPSFATWQKDERNSARKGEFGTPIEVFQKYLEHEVIHAAAYVKYRKDWIKGGKRGRFGAYVKKQNAQVGQWLRMSYRGLSPQLLAVYDSAKKLDVYGKGKEQENDFVVGTEFLRMLVERARTGQLTEDVAIQARLAKSGGIATQAYNTLIRAIQRMREVLARYLNASTSTPSIQNMLKEMNDVLDKYGIIKPNPETAVSEVKAKIAENDDNATVPQETPKVDVEGSSLPEPIRKELAARRKMDEEKRATSQKNREALVNENAGVNRSKRNLLEKLEAARQAIQDDSPNKADAIYEAAVAHVKTKLKWENKLSTKASKAAAKEAFETAAGFKISQAEYDKAIKEVKNSGVSLAAPSSNEEKISASLGLEYQGEMMGRLAQFTDYADESYQSYGATFFTPLNPTREQVLAKLNQKREEFGSPLVNESEEGSSQATPGRRNLGEIFGGVEDVNGLLNRVLSLNIGKQQRVLAQALKGVKMKNSLVFAGDRSQINEEYPGIYSRTELGVADAFQTPMEGDTDHITFVSRKNRRLSDADASRIALHEVLHQATAQEIDEWIENPTEDGPIAELNRILEFVKTQIPITDADSRSKGYYLTNLHEFIAGVFTDPIFSEQLKGMAWPSTDESVWQRIVNFIAKSLGFSDTDSLLIESVKQAVEIMRIQQENLVNENEGASMAVPRSPSMDELDRQATDNLGQIFSPSSLGTEGGRMRRSKTEKFDQLDLPPDAYEFRSKPIAKGAFEAMEYIYKVRGVLNAAEEIVNNPELVNVGLDSDARTMLTQQVARGLKNMIEIVSATQINPTGYKQLVELKLATDRAFLFAAKEAGRKVAAYRGDELLVDGSSAKNDLINVFRLQWKRYFRNSGNDWLESITSELNQKRKDVFSKIITRGEFITFLNKFLKEIGTIEWRRSMRKTIAQTTDKARFIAERGASLAGRMGFGNLDSEPALKSALNRILSDITMGIPKTDNAEQASTILSAAIAEVTRGQAREAGVIPPAEKITKITQLQKLSEILNNAELYDQFVANLEERMINKLGGNSQSPHFQEAMANFVERMNSRAWMDGMIDAVLSERMKAMKVSLTRAVKEIYKGADHTFENVTEEVKAALRENGVVDPEIIDAVSQDIDARMESMVEQAKETWVGKPGSVKLGLRDLGIKMLDYIGTGITNQDAIATRLSDHMAQRLGIANEGQFRHADQLEKIIRDALADMTKTETEDVITRLENRAPAGVKKLTGKQRKDAMSELVKYANIGALTNIKAYQTLAKQLGLPEYKEADALKAEQLGREIADMPDGRERTTKIGELRNFIESKKGASWQDMTVAGMYASMLSGPSTLAVNAVSNIINLISEMYVLAIQNPRNIMTIASAILRIFDSGLIEFKETWRTGLSAGKLNVKVEGGNPAEFIDPEFTSDPKSVIPEAWQRGTASALYKLLSLTRAKYVVRFLQATDMMFYKAAQEASFAAKTGYSGYGTKLSGFKTEVREEMLDQGQEVDTKEGKRLIDLRALERLDQSRANNPEYQTAWEEAHGDALRITFNQDPQGFIGKAAELASTLTSEYPIGKVIIPFTRVVANVLNTQIDWSPFGAARWLLSDKFKIENADKEMVRDPRILIRSITGMLFLVAITAAIAKYHDDDDPWFTVYGAGPTDANKKRQLYERGWKPNTIKIGDSYISYLTSPVALALSVIGTVTDRWKEKPDQNFMDIIPQAALAFVQGTLHQSFVSGAADLISSFDSADPEARMTRIMARTLTLWVPNLFKQVDQWIDPSVQQSDSFIQMMVNQVPFVRQIAANKPMLNVFGEPVIRTQGPLNIPFLNRFWTVEKTSDPVWSFVAERNLAIPSYNKQSHIGDQKMTQEQYYEYVVKSGPRIKEAIRIAIPELRGMNKQEAQEAINDISEGIKRETRGELSSR